jgi:hypothetical protein
MDQASVQKQRNHNLGFSVADLNVKYLPTCVEADPIAYGLVLGWVAKC